MLRLVARWESPSYHWWLNPSGDGASEPLKLSRVLVAYRDRGWVSPQPIPLPTSSNGSLSVCGEGMPQCGSAASHHVPSGRWGCVTCICLLVCSFGFTVLVYYSVLHTSAHLLNISRMRITRRLIGGKNTEIRIPTDRPRAMPSRVYCMY